VNRKIVAAASSINGGKDYIMNKLQNRLVHQHHYTMSTVRTRFADSLNEAVAPILGISGKELQDRSLKEEKRFSFGTNRSGINHKWSSRDVQKRVAELLREELGEDVFVNALDRRCDGILLISDLRYPNELEWVRSQGGKVVYIHNEKAAVVQCHRESAQFGENYEHHPPESELLQWDFYNKVETPDYWLDNNDFAATQPFDDFVKFVLDYLEN
jgi:hypothetical protein